MLKCVYIQLINIFTDLDLKDTLQAFKAVRLFDPSRVTELVADVDSLPFLSDTAVINGLKSELATYSVKAEDVSSAVSKTGWWKQHSQNLPCWLYLYF